CARGGEDFEFW
nr:immunoglobulin heavy chain junction region [Macaca mulatta]MOV36574.1 immunoglobulin heavy chain junction region [Macaca mulatta]